MSETRKIAAILFADVVGWVGFAREDDLNWPSGGVENPREPLGILKNELGPLIAGEAARGGGGTVQGCAQVSDGPA